MPAWLLSLISTLAVPVLEQVLSSVLKGLELQYPGLTPIINAILAFLNKGGSAEALQKHCEGLPGFCPTDLK